MDRKEQRKKRQKLEELHSTNEQCTTARESVAHQCISPISQVTENEVDVIPGGEGVGGSRSYM